MFANWIVDNRISDTSRSGISGVHDSGSEMRIASGGGADCSLIRVNTANRRHFVFPRCATAGSPSSVILASPQYISPKSTAILQWALPWVTGILGGRGSCRAVKYFREVHRDLTESSPRGRLRLEPGIRTVSLDIPQAIVANRGWFRYTARFASCGVPRGRVRRSFV